MVRLSVDYSSVKATKRKEMSVPEIKVVIEERKKLEAV
jgi:hypothetical protein